MPRSISAARRLRDRDAQRRAAAGRRGGRARPARTRRRRASPRGAAPASRSRSGSVTQSRKPPSHWRDARALGQVLRERALRASRRALELLHHAAQVPARSGPRAGTARAPPAAAGSWSGPSCAWRAARRLVIAGGANSQPTRAAGNSVFENVPRYETSPRRSSARSGGAPRPRTRRSFSKSSSRIGTSWRARDLEQALAVRERRRDAGRIVEARHGVDRAARRRARASRRAGRGRARRRRAAPAPRAPRCEASVANAHG